jgi:hypothetical protein
MNYVKIKYSLPILFLVLVFPSKSVYPKDFKGAEYRTKTAYTYGRFEVRYKSVNREGVLASFFTYHDGGGDWNEIDIEILGRYENDVQFNTITAGPMNHVRHQFVDFNPHLDFHTYAFEWTPQYVAWFIDGDEVYRQTGEHIQTITLPQKIMMNIWNPQYDNWIGDWNPNILPAFAYYDWVSYYAYTEGSGNYGTGNNFTHIWTDDFNSWDQTRWDKATHTWDGNNCDFIYANAVIQDGMLILCLTDAANTGFTDLKKPELLYARTNNEYNKILVSFTEELDKTTAENISNYFIADTSIKINSTTLLSNQKSVELSVTGLDASKSPNLIVLNVKDKAVVPNVIAPKAVTIINAQPLTFPVKINLGGSRTMGYLAEQEWSYTNEHGYLDGTSTQWQLAISNTDEDSVYWGERYNLVTYMVRVPAGSYNVKLMFAEKYWEQQGARIFDVYIEGTKVIDDLDIYKVAGFRTAYETTFPNIVVNDGILDINFCSEEDNPLINGIIIEANPTGLMEKSEFNPNKFSLEQNYPNPFNPFTNMQYSVSSKQFVVLKVFDVLGNEIATLVDEEKPAGNYKVTWNAENLSSGIYFYELNAEGKSISKKMCLLK